MAGRGPKPKPAAVKRQRGSSGRPVIDDQVAAAAAPAPGLAAPAWLKDAAREIWEAKAGLLSAAKLLTAADATAFGRYCRNLADWLAYKETLDAKGHTYEIETASGLVVRPRPEFGMAERLERMLLAAEDRFGLNPAERQRIFAARANAPNAGDLFAAPTPTRREGDPAAPAAEPARPIEGPIGLLN